MKIIILIDACYVRQHSHISFEIGSDISLFEGEKNRFHSSDRFTADIEKERKKQKVMVVD